MKDRIVGGVLGLVVGDALGVPVEFNARYGLRKAPVTGMRGYGTYNQPPGTWSDDSSLALATVESMLAPYSLDDMMARFSRWLFEAYMTPHGKVFDVGGTTRDAINRFYSGAPPEKCGGTDESSNGNGSLMRILPLALHSFRCAPDELVARAFVVSALTHAHIRSKLCCAFYCLIAKAVLEGQTLRPALSWASRHLEGQVDPAEAKVLKDILTGSICDVPEKDVRSDGYVVDTLGASLWCCANHSSYRDVVLAAVNLGGDADTTGAVAGGLAGVIHGASAIPVEWIEALARKEMVVSLARRFADKVIAEDSR